MTKSTITRERLDWLSQISCRDDIEDIGGDEIRELASMALAAMDSSESVELPLDYLQGHKDGLEWAAQLAEANLPETGDWLYDDNIELAKAIRKGPDMPPAQPAADSEPVAWTWHYREQWHVTNDSRRAEFVAKDGDVAVLPLYRHAQPAPASEPVYQYWCYTAVENSEGDPEEFWFWKDCEKDFYDRWKNAKRTLYKTPQPALVVPPEQHWEELCRQHPDMSIGDAIIRAAWWNHCRAAMLQENPVCTCPSGDGSLRWPCQVHPGSSPVIPDGSASMLRRWLAFGRGMQNAGSQLPHNLIAETESMLAVAPQPQNAPQNIPEIIPGWIPVSEQKPDCWCLTCRPVVLNDMRFVVCPDCGNKRCPRANDHRNACTGSNEPGQEGNAYPDTPREVKP
ncbi:TPA: hypothetical protein ACN7NB_000708 [Klebsiella pneumoniae]